MNVQVDERNGSVAGPPPTRPPDVGPRRRSWWWLAIVLVVVIGLAASAVALARYQPLVPGSSAAFPMPGGRFATDPPDSRTISRIPFTNGAEVMYAFSIRNEGPLGVTITSVSQPPPLGGVLRTLRVWVGSQDQPGATRNPADYAPFRGASLAPGHERYFLVRAQFVHCDALSLGSATITEQVPVRYRVLGITHHAGIPLGLPIEVDSVENACGA